MKSTLKSESIFNKKVTNLKQIKGHTIEKQQQPKCNSVEKELIITIERCAKQWLAEGQQRSHLLRGEFLVLAQKLYTRNSLYFSEIAHKLIISSLEFKAKSPSFRFFMAK